MNFKKSALASAIPLPTPATGAAAFAASSREASGFAKNETAALQGRGTVIGQANTWNETGSQNDSGDITKFENTAKVFINGDVADNAALHAELNFVYDTEATPNDYQGHMNYSQQDYVRELYVDSLFGENQDIEVRVGKQQVVWGTADGIKLLDIINPTDYREFAQNTMEDSRIPVWMAKVEAPVGDSGTLQFVLSQAEGNKIAGLNANGDDGHAFIMKGVDTLTGSVNGFINVAPGLGASATAFENAYGAAGGLVNAAGAPGYTVGGFADSSVSSGDFDNLCTTRSNAVCLYQIANTTSGQSGTKADGSTAYTGGANYQDTLNLADSDVQANWDTSNPNSMFEYMYNTAFSTFDAFIGMDAVYRVEKPDDTSLNPGVRYKFSTDDGTNVSLNYFYHYDSNPYVDLSWENQAGSKLHENVEDIGGYKTVRLSTTAGSTTNTVGGNADGGTAGVIDDTTGTKVARLVMTEKYNRIHSLGASFDTTFETAVLPVVIRGEFLYDKDVKTPVITRLASDSVDLSRGFFTRSLKNEDADFFKYVIGADVSVLTNMLVSGQFIQFRNLDYVDIGDSSASDWKYTADSAVMHMTNNFKKAKENKEFYSLFLSKPFGPNQLGRWNNIFMYEEDGGKWNRFDVEYSFSDELVGSFELNNYWGDANTQFGQMEDSSNIQVGLKYIF